MANRVLVTGGAGFIGSHVADHFLDHGWEVEIIDDLSSGKRNNAPSGSTLHVLDVRSPDAARTIREGSFDVVLHFAAQMDVRKSVADPVHDADVNVLGTLNLVEAIRSSNKASSTRFLYASTGGVLYGDFVTPPNEETTPKDPESPYAISKLSVEHYLGYYGRVHALDTVALRYGNVYGPRQDPHGEAGVVAIFCGRILEGKPLTVFGDGTQTRDYVYISDVVRATWMAATHALPAAGRLDSRGFNIGTGLGTPVIEIARTLLRVSESSVSIQLAPPRAGEQMHSFLDVTKAANVLGWTPGVTLEQGLRESFNWFSRRYRTTAVRA